MSITKIEIVDSHTGGEPTRVVVSGGPPLPAGPLSERLAVFRSRYDHFRSAIVNEPRGYEAIVGALLCEPVDESCTAGVIFFNNVGYLGMCGHGTIGLMATLSYLNQIEPGSHLIETPIGVIEAHLHKTGEVTVANVPSHVSRTGVRVEVPPFGTVTGDVAWGGNWFFLSRDCPLEVSLQNIDRLTEFTKSIRTALAASAITGDNGAEIDHVAVFGPPSSAAAADSKNFVLCPGGSYDRSPCGTGTSAKMASLYAAGKLRENELWRQESITGSIFEGSVRIADGLAYPSITGSAFVNAESTLVLDDRDPLQWGLKGSSPASYRLAES